MENQYNEHKRRKSSKPQLFRSMCDKSSRILSSACYETITKPWAYIPRSGRSLIAELIPFSPFVLSTTLLLTFMNGGNHLTSSS